jgi:acyl carrier protein
LQLGPNGKIDLATMIESEAPFIPPALSDSALDGELEILVAEIWQEVLSLPINRETNFFTDAGGHSLMATQAVSRLNAALGIRMPLAAIFEDPTPRRLAQRLETLLLTDAEMSAS